MSYLLSDPTTVLVVGGTPDRREAVASAVEDGAAAAVVTVETAEETRTSLDARDDVGCVVVLDSDPDTVAEICEAAAGAEPSGLLPVVACGDESVARVAADHEACRYLPRSSAPEDLREVVDDALASYRRRRDEAADSTILGTLFAEGKMTMFAKDEAGRYVRMADVPYTPDPEEARGKTDIGAFGDHYPEASQAAYEDDLDVVETGEPLREQLEQYEGRGGDHWSEATKLPWEVDGEILGLVGFAVDVTDRVRYEQDLAEERRRFDQFASYVSHDLRTPLQVAVGALEQARESEGEELTAALDRIEHANRRIEEILEDLSALSKGNRDEALPEEVLEALDVGVPETDLARLVENVWRVDGTEAATLELAIPEGTVLRAETETVRPLVENLLKNAVEHGSTSPGSQARQDAVDHAGEDVTVRVGTTGRGFFVADDGPGIPDEEREKVLEPGYTTSEDGTGTGLDIVRETVEQEEWDLTIGESESGGARFEVRDAPVVIPRAVTPAETVALTDNADVGNVSLPGEATYDEHDDRWTVVGGGRDIWQDIDEFHFVYAKTRESVRIEGRLAELEDVHEYTKAGLMLRNSLDDDAAFVFVGATGEHGTETLWRERGGADAASEQFEEPYDAYQWYRADFVDGEVTLSFSTDGQEWQYLDQRTVDLDGELCVGLVVCSHDTERTAEAQFEDVTVSRLDVE